MADLLLDAAASPALVHRLFRPNQTLHAPHLLDLEVLQTLRRLERARVLTRFRADAAVAVLVDLPLTRYPHDVLANRVWELRGALTAYDAAYVALAEALAAPLLTRDERLASAAPRGARVEVV